MSPEQAAQIARLYLSEPELRDFEWDGKQWVKKPPVPMGDLLGWAR